MAGSKEASPKACKKCKAADAPYNQRSAPTCQKCYVEFLDSKLVKSLRVLHHETRGSTRPEPRRFAAGLSFGPASSALVSMMDRVSKYYAESKSSSPLDVLFMHVDTDLSHANAGHDSPAETLLAKYRESFPSVKFEVMSLAKVFEAKTINWTSLPLEALDDPLEKLRRMFDALPSITSKADVLRQLVRHLLVHVAMQRECKALLLGHTTTSLAALTLSEVANGRGFAVPWQVNDSKSKFYTYQGDGSMDSEMEFAVWYPLREIYSNEIKTMVDFTPALRELKLADSEAGNSVVSHKDTSILEVMSRYFEGVEGAYSGIVANVVRTAGKLDKPAAQGRLCGLCASVLDEHGDARWAGELGNDDSNEQHLPQARICYGCKRSVNG